MNEKEFKNLVKKDRYQIFVFSSRLPFPLSFVTHCWIVSVKRGIIKRYEVLHRENNGNYLHVDFWKPWLGVGKYLWNKDPRWESALLGSLEGKKGSIAEKMTRALEKSSNYPFKKKYHFFPGPNSNTFVQWILNAFAGCGLRLPWTAFGKEYRCLRD